jgi:transposase
MLTTPMEMTDQERLALEQFVRRRAGRADLAKRARVLLLLAEGCSYADIRGAVGCSPNFIATWKQRFVDDRVARLSARHRGRKA